MKFSGCDTVPVHLTLKTLHHCHCCWSGITGPKRTIRKDWSDTSANIRPGLFNGIMFSFDGAVIKPKINHRLKLTLMRGDYKAVMGEVFMTWLSAILCQC